MFKRSSGIYYISFFSRGRRVWKSTGERNRPRALLALANFDPESFLRKRHVSLAEFQREFLAFAMSGYSPYTVNIYARSLSQFQTVAGDIFLSSINYLHIDQYKVARLKQVSSTSVNIELRSLRAAFYRAVKWRLLDENPFKKVSLLRVPAQQPLYLTRKEFDQLLSIVKERWLRDLLVVAVSTGLRRGELLNLKWSDVDFQRAMIRVQSGENFHTKAGKQRVVPLNVSSLQVLFRMSQERSGEFVFTLNGGSLKGALVCHRFKRYVRRAGLQEKLHFHSLRHTFATWLVQQQVPIYDVQKLMGHSSISVTQIYAHLAGSELRRAVQMIEVSEN
ncbi:MAG: site-specific integrase [Bacteroidota bacterium]